MLVVPQVVLFLSHGDRKLNKVLKHPVTIQCVCVCACVRARVRACVRACIHTSFVELDVLLINLC
jgi:hypothetical protein